MTAALGKTICVIPARYASQRLKGKPLLCIQGCPLILWVYNNIVSSGVFDDVVVATDDTRICNAVRAHGGKALMTSKKHASGTDRVFEAVQRLRCKYVINVQGDEPQVPHRILHDMKGRLAEIDDDTLLTCATNATIEEMDDPNAVKVVLAKSGDALYFSRSAIPYYRSSRSKAGLKHVGIYGFTRGGIKKFCSLKRGKLEQAEKLEQLRALEGGMRIRCLVRAYRGIGIDTRKDLRAFKKSIAAGGAAA
jgi:3-deoxy-manno-octulosonate cytidylyltransferase (CMP-KDO synthetase)